MVAENKIEGELQRWTKTESNSRNIGALFPMALGQAYVQPTSMSGPSGCFLSTHDDRVTAAILRSGSVDRGLHLKKTVKGGKGKSLDAQRSATAADIQLGAKIRKFRLAAGISQTALGERLGVTVSRSRNTRRAPTVCR